MSRFMSPGIGAVLLAGLVFLAAPQQAFALFTIPPGGGYNNLGGGGFNKLGGGGGFNKLGGGGNQQQQTPQIQRATNTLSNPVNFWQYSQVTGVKPTVGTVRIYNQFGTLANQNGGGGGGGFGGFGGFGGGGFGGGNLPRVGTSSGGDDPPQGVLLSVNYANLFFPNQTQLNQTNQGGGGGFGGGGFGLGGLGGGFGYGGYNPGFGKGGFGSSGNGL